MPGFHLFTSNRLEILADRLAEILSVPLGSPLVPETIVVQSRGMERWVSMELARRHKICANIRFPFPNAFLNDVFAAVLGELPDPSPFDPGVMAWKIMKLLPERVRQPVFAPLGNYLQGEQEQLKRYQLAGRIADLFDQYLIFRPDWVHEWEQGTDRSDSWQPLLWRALVTEGEPFHRARLKAVFLERIRQPGIDLSRIPERVSIFGISALPPFHMEVFNELARFVEVNLFLLSPCREYWADIRSDREIARISRKSDQKETAGDILHLEKGNSLLASWGSLGRDFFHMIQGLSSIDQDLFEEPGETDLLHWIQSDILHLRDRDQPSKTPISGEDDSIMVHSCHGPMREIEVLHDNLLHLFAHHPGLEPRDVLVMTPDINLYAPYIQAVFEGPEDRGRIIPFTITDHGYQQESPLIGTFMALLELSGSRFLASRVLSLLESKPLRKKFQLADADLDTVSRWVRDTRVRWGIDAGSRVQMGFHGSAENSWRAGLDRLLLGYAMPGQDGLLFQGVLPYDHVEGSDAVVLGKFVEFVERIVTEVTGLARPRPLEAWGATLEHLLENFFIASPDTEQEILLLRQMLSELAGRQGLSGFDEELELEVIKNALRRRLEASGSGFGFITGGVTFCAMLPMRSIPFKIICLVGMNDNAFPRQTRPLGFDLISRTPRLGDRSQRNDDRYLFLEALLSARSKLYISYVGQSSEDNSTIPPSVLVSELLDAVDRGFEVPGGKILEHIVTRHRLQPFSPAYFREGDKLFSYSAENCEVARLLSGARHVREPFLATELPEPEEYWRTVEVDKLCAFLGNPAKFLLTQRLKIQLESKDVTVEDREAFELVGLEQYLLEQELLRHKIEDRDLEDWYPVVKASGRLPHGSVGRYRFQAMSRDVSEFFEKIRPFLDETRLAPQDVDLSAPPFRLTGRLDRLTGRGLVHYRNATVKPRDRLNAWVWHLVLNEQQVAGCPAVSIFLGRDCCLEFAPLANPMAHLNGLLEVFSGGLRKPLHFFPQTSFTYAQALTEKGKSEADAMKTARRVWQGGDYARGESEDPYLQLCFAAHDPLDVEFQQLALEIFAPLLEHQREFENILPAP